MSERWQGTHRVTSVAVVATLTAMLLAICVSAARAAPKLFLTGEEGGPYSGETNTGLEIEPAFGDLCFVAWIGVTDRNDAARIVMSLDRQIEEVCEQSDGPSLYAISTTLSKLTLRWNGQVKMSGSIEISGPGPCVYRFSGPTGTLEQPAMAGKRFPIVGEGSTTGTLVRRTSNIFCDPLHSLRWRFGSLSLTGERRNIEGELRG